MDYDIGKAFAAIEEELIASMIRNMQRHRDWEDDEGFRWSMWQAEQLKALEQYKRTNKKKFERQFNEINGSIRKLIERARERGSMDQELEILEAIKKGWKPPKRISKYMDTSTEFFRLNTRKLEALIKATENDFQRAEVAMLRMADDQYRKAIFNAQVYANTGAGTYEKAVDMATKDYRARGINCIEYSNGARHTMKDYADMAIRTAAKRAYLAGEGEKRQEWGIHTVIVHKRGNPCPLCLPFVGKVLIDDVWSGGSSASGQKYPLMSSAVDAGLYHPRCKDTHSTYFPGISEPPDDQFTKGEIADIEEQYREDQKQNYIDRQIEKYERLEENSLDEENKRNYARKVEHLKSVKGTVNGKTAKAADIQELNARATNAIRNTYDERINKQGLSYAHTSDLSEDGLDRISANFEGMDMRLAGPTADQFERLSDEYWTTCHSIKVGNVPATTAPAATSLAANVSSSNIVLSKTIMKDYDSFMERMANAVERGQFPKMDKSNYDKYVITHEFVHTLMDFDSKMKNSINAPTAHIQKARKELKKIHEEWKEEWRRLEVARKNAELDAINTMDEATWKKAQEATEAVENMKISEYAFEGIDEFVAEAFTDALIGSNPSDYSIKVKAVIDKYFKK